MSRLAPDFFERYQANPLALDAELRATYGIPANRYYTVSMFPIKGIVHISHLPRTVSAVKISKSDFK